MTPLETVDLLIDLTEATSAALRRRRAELAAELAPAGSAGAGMTGASDYVRLPSADAANRLLIATPSARKFLREIAEIGEVRTIRAEEALKARGQSTRGAWGALTKTSTRLFGQPFYGYAADGAAVITRETLEALRAAFGLGE